MYIVAVQLIVNALFSPAEGTSSSPIENKSVFAVIDNETDEDFLESLIDTDFECTVQGDLFISEGKPGKILKVVASGNIGERFIRAIEKSHFFIKTSLEFFQGIWSVRDNTFECFLKMEHGNVSFSILLRCEYTYIVKEAAKK